MDNGKLLCVCGKPLAVTRFQVRLHPTAPPALCLGAHHADGSPLPPECEEAIRKQPIHGLSLTANGPVVRKESPLGTETGASPFMPRTLVEIAPGWWSA